MKIILLAMDEWMACTPLVFETYSFTFNTPAFDLMIYMASISSIFAAAIQRERAPSSSGARR